MTELPDLDLARLALDIIAKATLLLLGASGVATLLRRRSADLRAALWTACMVALLALPLMAGALPVWRLPVTTPAWLVVAARSSAVRLEPPPTRVVPEPSRGHIDPSPAPARSRPASSVPSAPAPRPTATLATPAVLLLAWLVGGLLVATWFLAGHVGVWRLVRRATPMRDAGWLAAVRSSGARLGIGFEARLLVSPDTPVPLAWGAHRPTIVLPLAADGWSAAEREAVLLHELAHVHRRDCLMHAVGQLACALYWFHPGVWYAARRLRVERERACDDAVLLSGGDAHDYASQLLALARLARTTPRAAVAMARRSQLEMRLRAILDAAVVRRSPSVRRALVVAGLALAAISPLAAARPAFSASATKAVAPSAADDLAPAARAVATGADSVIVYAGPPAPLGTRWEWARQEAERRGVRELWIGYGIIRADGRAGGLFSDSDGRGLAIDIRGGQIVDRRLAGSEALSTMLRSRSGTSGDAAMLFLLRRASDARPSRIALRSARFAVPLEGRPLFWLGTASDDESVPLLSSLYEREERERAREVLIRGIAVHASSARVLPFLTGVLDGAASDDLRAEATEGLGFHDGADSMRLLMRLARSDRSGDVRTEAAETLGEQRRDDTTDSLVVLARGANDSEVRQEATETIGEIETPAAESLLVDIAFSDNYEDVQSEAAETLGELPGDRGLAQLDRILREHPREAVREEAVEGLESKSVARVLPILRRVVWEDRSESVQEEAVDLLGEIGTADAIALLREIVDRHPRTEVRSAAVEALGRG